MSKITQFKDVVSYARSGSYRVNQEWKYLKNCLANYQDRRGGLACLDLNPDFQRGHIWTEAQQIAFVEYILRGGLSGREIYLNCVGCQGSYKGPFVIVDGKQRLHAVLRFLDNEIPAFGSYYREFTDRLPTDAYFNINVNNLETREEEMS